MVAIKGTGTFVIDDRMSDDVQKTCLLPLFLETYFLAIEQHVGGQHSSFDSAGSVVALASQQPTGSQHAAARVGPAPNTD